MRCFSQILWLSCTASGIMVCDTWDFSFGADLFSVLSPILICDQALTFPWLSSHPLTPFCAIVIRLVVTSVILLTLWSWPLIVPRRTCICTSKQTFHVNSSLSLSLCIFFFSCEASGSCLYYFCRI